MKNQLSKKESEDLLALLKSRFENNKERHHDISWNDVQAKLEKSPDQLWSLHQMEITDGEPDVIGIDKITNELIFCDCSAETPKRRSLCYDKAAWESRKENKPKDNAMDVAKKMGIEIVNEEEYRHLQTLGEFDKKTSSWLKTSEEIRKLGGAIFGDRRYNHVFIYHNGAESYYAARGFRGILKV